MIELFPFGPAEKAISGEFTLTAGNDYSVFAAGNGITQGLKVWTLLDKVEAPISGSLTVRIVYAAPFSADVAPREVSIRTAGGDIVNRLVLVPYGLDSPYFEILAGSYDLKVASNDVSVNYIITLPTDLA